MAEHSTTPHATGRSVDDDNLDHVVCDHDPDTALCGSDVTDAPWRDTDTPCMVCVDLEDVYDAAGICCPKEVAL